MSVNHAEMVLDIFSDIEFVLKQLATGTPTVESANAAQRVSKNIRKVRARINEGKLSIRDEKEFWIFWLNGEYDRAVGHDFASAFTALGYGAGAMPAVDFYAQIPDGADMASRAPTLPDGAKARQMVCDYYYSNLLIHFRDLKEKLPEKDYVHALEDFHCNYAEGIAFPERPFFYGLHNALVKDLNPTTRHGKMYYAKFFEKNEDGHTCVKFDMYEASDENKNV
jgi:hypothetical protein